MTPGITMKPTTLLVAHNQVTGLQTVQVEQVQLPLKLKTAAEHLTITAPPTSTHVTQNTHATTWNRSRAQLLTCQPAALRLSYLLSSPWFYHSTYFHSLSGQHAEDASSSFIWRLLGSMWHLQPCHHHQQQPNCFRTSPRERRPRYSSITFFYQFFFRRVRARRPRTGHFNSILHRDRQEAPCFFFLPKGITQSVIC